MGKEIETPLPTTMEEAIARLQEVTELNKELTKKVGELEKTASKSEKIMEKLNSKISQLEKANITGDNRPVVTHDGVEYTVNSGARVGKRVLTPQQIAESSDAIAELLTYNGQTVLTPVEETEKGE